MCVTTNNRSGCSTGSVLSRRALSKLKIAVFAPMPNASDNTATAVNAGLRSSIRTP